MGTIDDELARNRWELEWQGRQAGRHQAEVESHLEAQTAYAAEAAAWAEQQARLQKRRLEEDRAFRDEQRRDAAEAKQRSEQLGYAMWRDTPGGQAYERWKATADAWAKAITWRDHAMADAYATDRAEAARLSGPLPELPAEPSLPEHDDNAAMIMGIPVLVAIVILIWQIVASGWMGIISGVLGAVVYGFISGVLCFVAYLIVHSKAKDKTALMVRAINEDHQRRLSEAHALRAPVLEARKAYLNGADPLDDGLVIHWQKEVENAAQWVKEVHAWAMTHFPTQDQLPHLELPTVLPSGEVKGGPEVHKVLESIRSLGDKGMAH